ncbi:MAG TPA: septum formation family protein [Candidatus Limnocylindrales bacterium]|jgi:hypothetical protein
MPAGFGTPPAADAGAATPAEWGAPSTPASPPPADTWGAPSAPAPGGAPGAYTPGTPLKPAGAPRNARIRSFIIIGVILVIIVGAVVINALGPSAVGDLKVGDCFDVPTGLGEADTVDTVQHHPCTQSHTAEVIFVGDYTGGTDLYPATTDFDTFVGNTCGPAFETYVGTSLDADPDLSIGYFYPLSDSWSNGERSVTCYAERTDETPMSSSVKGSGSGTPAGSSTP